MGYFSDIKIDTEPYKDGLKVIIILTERPIIDKITFSGLKRYVIKEEKLKQVLKSKETQYLDYPSLEDDVLTLKDMYNKKGFGQVKIEYNVEIDNEKNRAKVHFTVVEGDKYKIRDILIEGNKSFSDSRILKLLKTKKAWLFNPGVLKDEVLAEDIERIKSFYHKEGFVDVAVDYNVKFDENKPFMYIIIKIEEGKKYLVGNVAIIGNSDISEKLIISNLKESTPGKVFSYEAMRNDVANIQSVYYDRGYISANIDESSSLNSETGRVDISYKIVENKVSYVDKVRVRGNVKTKDIVIRRELRIRPGDKFDGEKLKRSKERLENLGFFDEVSYDTEDTDVENKKDLIVDVKEAKTGAFSFGGGYSTVDQFIGFVEIEQKNFDWKNFPYFTGAGQDLRVRAELGNLTSNYSLSFTEPWLFDYPVAFGFDAYRDSRDKNSDTGYGYDQTVTGGDVRLGKALTEYFRADVAYRYDRIEISSVDDDASKELKSEAGRNTISSMQLGLTFDTRDNVFVPKRGDVISGSIQGAGGFLGGTKDFVKFYGRASHYVPLFRGSVLEFRGRVGLADPYGDTKKIPIYERFFAGGADTVRGYNERKVGPIDPDSKDPLGGDSMLIGNIEYTYPLFDFLKVATFFDIGNVWPLWDDIGTDGMKKSVGVGVRLRRL
jgi:outer membrane protein insertion porin family